MLSTSPLWRSSRSCTVDRYRSAHISSSSRGFPFAQRTSANVTQELLMPDAVDTGFWTQQIRLNCSRQALLVIPVPFSQSKKYFVNHLAFFVQNRQVLFIPVLIWVNKGDWTKWLPVIFLSPFTCHFKPVRRFCGEQIVFTQEVLHEHVLFRFCEWLFEWQATDFAAQLDVPVYKKHDSLSKKKTIQCKRCAL